MASDPAVKRPSIGSLDEDAEGKASVLKLFNKFGGSKGSRRTGTDALLSPTSAPQSISGSSASSQSSVPPNSRNSQPTKQPLSARDDNKKAVPGLTLPGASTSVSDGPDYSPGRPIGQKKPHDPQDKSLNASTTSLATRKFFLGKPDSLTTDDFTLWKQYREFEPEFSTEVNSTSPFPFFKVVPPSEDEDQEEEVKDRNAIPDLASSGAALHELQPPKEDPHEVPYEQWYQQMINLVQLHKQELSSIRYNESSTPRSARNQSASEIRS